MELRQVEPLFVLLSLLALVACASRLVPSATQARLAAPPSPTPTREHSPALRATPVPQFAEARLGGSGETTVPAGCVVRDVESRAYVNVEDGYCLRYPAGFRRGEVLPGIANFYGPPRAPGAAFSFLPAEFPGPEQYVRQQASVLHR